MTADSLLVAVLLDPGTSAALTLAEWDLLVRQARRANLLARLALRLRGRAVPAVVQAHFDAAELLATRQAVSVRHELAQLAGALAELGAPVVLLKGAAYVAAGLDAGEGRMFSDVDILVPKPALPRAETALVVNGWDFDDLDAYDQRYYRTWMHELPPLHHRRRGTVLDVHHTLLPPTSRTRLASEHLFEQLRPLADWPGLSVLPPADMVLHSATHLFHEGEFDNGLRDLFDLDALLRQFEAQDLDFWDRLAGRAVDLGLSLPLHHALRYASRLLGTPVPAAMFETLAPAAPGVFRQGLLDFAFGRALRPQHASAALPATPAALLGLYVRSHWLRMPLPLLVRHLGRKAWGRLRPPEETSVP